MAEYEMEPFGEVLMLGRWPVRLPAYRVAHCAQQPNWEEGRLLSMHAHLKPGDVLYDVGAEHGDLSALYGTWVQYHEDVDDENDYQLRGGVVLVEGSDKFWPVIKATFEANGLAPVGCYAGFASDVDSPEELRTPSWSDPTMTLAGQWPGWATDWEPAGFHGFKSLVESKQTIPNITFDSLWQGGMPSLCADGCPAPTALTIDVEGAELRVLHGSERILRECRPLVWVSVHPTLIAHDYPESGVLGTGDPDYERQRVLDYMTAAGYEYQHLESNHEEHWLFWPQERTDFDPWKDVEHLRDGVHP